MANAPGMITRNRMRTNDGKSVPVGAHHPTREGPLLVGSDIDNSEHFNDPTQGDRAINGKIVGMESLQPGQTLDEPGFDASGRCFVKHGTPYGEAALFNQLPPGHDINDQRYLVVHNMPLRLVTDIGYPGDGGFAVRDIPE